MVENVREILHRSLAGDEISRSECLRLMEIKNNSSEMYELSFVADRLTRRMFDDVGEVHAQVGIDYSPCPKKCRFCVFGNIVSENLELGKGEVVVRAKEFERAGADAIYLMTTARFDFDEYISIGRVVRKAISPRIPLVANIGDFVGKLLI